MVAGTSGTTAVSGTQILRNIDKVSQYMTDHTETLPDSIYQAMNGFSKTFLAYRDAKGQPGWADNLKDSEGKALWTTQQVDQLSTLLMDVAQVGGAPDDIQLGAESKLVQTTKPNDFSLDGIYENVKSYLASLDETNRELAQAIGPVAFVQTDKDPKLGPFPPFVPFEVPLPNRMILPAVNAFLETLRLIVSNSVYDISFLRKILSLVLGIFDVLRGNWRDGVLSLLGVYSQNAMFVGMVGKLVLWVYMFISPDIRGRLADDMFAASKSMVVGSWLWMFSVVSPDFVRKYVNSLFGTVQARANELNQKIASIEKVAQASVQGQGLEVEFPRVPLNTVPSYDDIQNFQALIHRPEIYCSDAVQTAIQPLISFATFRVILELLNIPTLPDKKEEMCKDVPPTIEQAIEESLKPTVTPEPSLKPTVEPEESKEEDEPTEPSKESNEKANEPQTPMEPNGPKSRKTRKQSGGIRRTRRMARLF
jgi:hypothetical protein